VATDSPGRPSLTVAIVSWNTRELLADCLRALAQDAEDGLAEVWVFDNASSDGSAALVREQFPWAKLIASAENLGFGAGVNAVAAPSRTPWVVPANADTRVEPGALRTLLEAGARTPKAAVLAPMLRLPDGTVQHSAYPFPSVAFALAYVTGVLGLSRRLARRWRIGRGFDPTVEQEVPWVVGAFLLVRRTAWDEVGGFDEAQWMYAEDLDLGWRLDRAGWRALYVPRAQVIHAESAATTQAWGDTRHDRWHASTYAWVVRRRGLLYARLLAATYVVGFRVRSAMLLPLARAGSSRARRARHDALNAARAHSVGLRSRRMLERVR